MIYLLYAYLLAGIGFTIWTVRSLWQEDRRSDQTGMADKFGYNFRKNGRFTITTGASILIVLTLPVINIATFTVYLLSVYSDRKK